MPETRSPVPCLLAFTGSALTLMRNVESVYFQSMTKEDEKNKSLREKLQAEDQACRHARKVRHRSAF